MNKREAKRLACFHAGLLIDGALSNGWESLDRYGENRPKVVAALNELVDELHRRGGEAPC